MNPEKFCLITTEAIDHIFLQDKEIIEKNGGTTAFYKKAAKELRKIDVKNTIDLIWITPPKKTDVYIYPSQNYGYGVNDSTVMPDSVDKALKDNEESAVLISTTLKDDFDLSLLKNYLNKVKYVFIDVQGFTRDGKERKYFSFPDWLLQQNNLVIKASDEELLYINLRSILKNPETIVLNTKGKDGINVMSGGIKTHILPSERFEISNEKTRGAGDTFFFNFAINYLQNKDAITAAKLAEKSTVQFLKKRL